jgi:hypothetical protein
MDPISVGLIFGLIKETVKITPDIVSLIKGVEDGATITQEDIDEIKANRAEIDDAVDEFMQD